MKFIVRLLLNLFQEHFSLEQVFYLNLFLIFFLREQNLLIQLTINLILTFFLTDIINKEKMLYVQEHFHLRDIDYCGFI